MTLRELLEQKTQKYPQKTFLYFKELRVSYKQMDELANRIGNGLRAIGVQKGDKVCLLLPNCPEFIHSWFGALKIGAVTVPINPMFKADEIQYIVDNSDAATIITLPRFKEAIQKIKPQCSKLKNIIMIGQEKEEEGITPFSRLLDSPSSPPDVRLGEQDDAAIIYTSGTTGYPKGVILTHKNYLTNAYQLVQAAKMTEKDNFLCILPLFHVNAQIVTTLSPLYAGGSMTLLEGFSPKEFLPALSKYKATAFSGVPTVYAILNSLPNAESFDLSSLRFCICGAAPMPVEVFQTFEKKYKAFILEGYGLSEGTCASSVNPLEGKRKIGSIGVPLVAQDMKIVDDNGKEPPSGQVGEIVVKGENVMKGYYKNPTATKEALKGAWLHTGDLGYKDEEGYFFIVGRKKEMIIRGGENIYPKEIEEVLYKHPAIQEAAVVGIPDKMWGEEVTAFIVLKEGKSLPEPEFFAYCKEHVADFKCPRKLVYRQSFPKTATGKIQKAKIIEDYCKQAGIDPKATFAAKK